MPPLISVITQPAKWEYVLHQNTTYGQAVVSFPDPQLNMEWTRTCPVGVVGSYTYCYGESVSANQIISFYQYTG